MARISREFIKLEIRLLNDHRFFTMTDDLQLFYIKMMMISRSTENRIPKDVSIIRQLLRSEDEDVTIESHLSSILDTFPKFKGNKHFYYFEGYEGRLNGTKLNVPKKVRNYGVDEDEDEEEDKGGTQLISLIVDYLNSKAKKSYSINTKSTVGFIQGRLSEGRTFEDFKHVIDVKCEDWLGTEHEKYLRPSTLFNPTKFEGYINQKNGSVETPEMEDLV